MACQRRPQRFVTRALGIKPAAYILLSGGVMTELSLEVSNHQMSNKDGRIIKRTPK